MPLLTLALIVKMRRIWREGITVRGEPVEPRIHFRDAVSHCVTHEQNPDLLSPRG